MEEKIHSQQDEREGGVHEGGKIKEVVVCSDVQNPILFTRYKEGIDADDLFVAMMEKIGDRGKIATYLNDIRAVAHMVCSDQLPDPKRL